MARHQAAQARKQLAQSISELSTDAFSSFERFEQKVEIGEAEADAHAEVAGEIADVERQVRQLERSGEVEDELAALKQRLTLEKAERQ